MYINTVLGARPQFIKAAPVSKALRKAGIEEQLIHTGQHYDFAMSELFFQQLRIPRPAHFLGLGGGGHGQMTGQMLAEIEPLLLRNKPDAVLVYGDTNSTLAGALAAAKLHIPVIHVEAGLRSYNRRMPEEVNRVLTDHISSLLFCSSEQGMLNLAMEGVREGVFVSGDVMADAADCARLALTDDAFRARIDRSLPMLPDSFLLMTLHRAENTDSPERMASILRGIASARMPIVFPIHPRTSGVLERYGMTLPEHVIRIPPAGYFEMCLLLERCAGVVTDSGGLQKEAYWFRRPCLTLRDETEWIETVGAGWNTVVGADHEAIVRWLDLIPTPEMSPELYGGGGASGRIAAVLAANGGLPFPTGH